ALAPGRASTGCEAAGSRAEQAICADPALAAADQEMRRAYRRALDSGAAPAPLRASQEDWLIASEVAADRSPADLAGAYRRRIAELNAVAVQEPPH
ncbi:MAG: lysozyme inhibitor LprI family protein, partial [Caulobacterales bacterium]